MGGGEDMGGEGAVVTGLRGSGRVTKVMGWCCGVVDDSTETEFIGPTKGKTYSSKSTWRDT